MDFPSLSPSHLPRVIRGDRQPTWPIHSDSNNWTNSQGFPAKISRQNFQVLHRLLTLRQSITNLLSLQFSLCPVPNIGSNLQVTKAPRGQIPLPNKHGECLHSQNFRARTLKEQLPMNPRISALRPSTSPNSLSPQPRGSSRPPALQVSMRLLETSLGPPQRSAAQPL